MPLLEKQCVVCNTSFVPKSKTHPNQKHCSTYCIKLKYSLANPEKDRESKRRYAANNKEKHTQSTETYRLKNPGYYRQYSSLRTRKVQQARPKWLDEFQELWLDEIYDLAIKRGLQVDHIIPITNPIVCGLHVPWNLQLLTKEENVRKSNKFNPDEDIVAIIKEGK